MAERSKAAIRQANYRERLKQKTKDAGEAPKPSFKITDGMLMAARAREPKVAVADVFRRAKPLPGVLADKSPAMAMDEYPVADQAVWASYGLAFSEGLQFLGYPYLAQLAQRPEYRRIVEVIATEMTRKWIEFRATGDDGEGTQEDKADKIAAIGAEFERLRVRACFKEIAEQDGYFGRSHLYIDTGDGDLRDELKTSIGNGSNEASKAKIGKGKLKALRTVEAVWTYPTNYNSNDPLKGDWYKPDMWFVMGKEVHSSRLLTFIGREVPDLLKPAYSFGGLSLTQMAKPYVDNWLETRQSVNDLIQSFTVWILKTDMAQRLQAGGDESLMRRIELFTQIRNNRGVMATDKELEDFGNVSTSIAGLHELQAQAQEHLASVSGIPLVKLLGNTPSGLNACLPGNTLVLTDRGQVQIKDVTLSDKVMTRRGFAPLTFSGITKFATELVEIKTANATLRCTGNHPIWLPSTNEFVPAENVKVGDRLLLIGEKHGARNMRHQSRGAANGGGDGATVTMPLGTERQGVLFSSIARFGKRIAGKYRPAFTSTISTMIESIISSQICCRCSQMIMPRIMASTLWLAPSYAHAGKRPSSVSTAMSRSSSQSFLAGVSSALANALWRIGGRTGLHRPSQSLFASVKYAAHLSRPYETTLNTVRVNALRLVKIVPLVPLTCGAITKRILRNSGGDFARSDVQKDGILRASASVAERCLSLIGKTTKRIAQRLAKFAQGESDSACVVSVRKIPANEWVYDLTVGEGHLPEFYANGILTHNSSDGEIRVFYDWIAAQQQSLFADHLRKILHFVQLSLFGEVDPEITFDFVPLWQMTEKEKAEVEYLKAQTAQILMDAGVISPQEERQRVVDDPESQYGSLDVDDMPDLLQEEEDGLAPKGGHFVGALADKPEDTGERDKDAA